MSWPGGCWGSRPWATSLLPTWPTSARAAPLTAREYPLLGTRRGMEPGLGKSSAHPAQLGEHRILVPCFGHQRRWDRAGICPPRASLPSLGIPALLLLQLLALGRRYWAQQARFGGCARGERRRCPFPAASPWLWAGMRCDAGQGGKGSSLRLLSLLSCVKGEPAGREGAGQTRT